MRCLVLCRSLASRASYLPIEALTLQTLQRGAWPRSTHFFLIYPTARKVFFCDTCYIYQVPTHVLQHVELNKLLLDNNKLSSLPEDIKLMTSLEVNRLFLRLRLNTRDAAIGSVSSIQQYRAITTPAFYDNCPVSSSPRQQLPHTLAG
jgi:hypothetical protein